MAPHDVIGTFTENLSYLNDVVVTNQLSANQQVKLNYQDPNLLNTAGPNIVVMRTAPNGSAMENKSGDRTVPSKSKQTLQKSQKEGHLVSGGANNAQGPPGGNLLNLPLRIKEGKGQRDV